MPLFLNIVIPLWNPTFEQMKYWYDFALSNPGQIFVLVHDCIHYYVDSESICYIHYDYHGFCSDTAKNFYVLKKFGWKGIPSSLAIAAEFLISLELTWLDSSFVLVLDQDTKVNSLPLEESSIPFLSSNTIGYPGNIRSNKVMFLSLPWIQWSGSLIPFTHFVNVDYKTLPKINHSDLFFMINSLQSGYLFEKIPSFSIDHQASPDRIIRIFGKDVIVPVLRRSFMALCSSITFLAVRLRSPALIIPVISVVCIDLFRFILSLLQAVLLVFGVNILFTFKGTSKKELFRGLNRS